MDFRDRHLSLDDIGDTISYDEACDLVAILSGLPGTHTHAAVHRWAWPMTLAAIDARQQLQAFINVHRDRKKHPHPFELEFPWPDEEDVDPELRAALTAELKRRSVFRDRD